MINQKNQELIKPAEPVAVKCPDCSTAFYRFYREVSAPIKDRCPVCGKDVVFEIQKKSIPANQEAWEKEFDEAVAKSYSGQDPYWPDWESVKDFIRSLLASQKKETIRKVDYLLKEASQKIQGGGNGRRILTQFLSKLDEMGK